MVGFAVGVGAGRQHLLAAGGGVGVVGAGEGGRVGGTRVGAVVQHVLEEAVKSMGVGTSQSFPSLPI